MSSSTDYFSVNAALRISSNAFLLHPNNPTCMKNQNRHLTHFLLHCQFLNKRTPSENAFAHKMTVMVEKGHFLFKVIFFSYYWWHCV